MKFPASAHNLSVLALWIAILVTLWPLPLWRYALALVLVAALGAVWRIR